MIDLTQLMPCECGQPDCDYDETAPMGDAQAVAEALVLHSPILRLVKERDEARRMCELLAAAMPDLVFAATSQKATDAANRDMHQALMAYVKTKKLWSEGGHP